jgi:hypothetical protein
LTRPFTVSDTSSASFAHESDFLWPSQLTTLLPGEAFRRQCEPHAKDQDFLDQRERPKHARPSRARCSGVIISKMYHLRGHAPGILTIETPLFITDKIHYKPPLFVLSIQINKLITMPVMVFDCLNSYGVKSYVGPKIQNPLFYLKPLKTPKIIFYR